MVLIICRIEIERKNYSFLSSVYLIGRKAQNAVNKFREFIQSSWDQEQDQSAEVAIEPVVIK